MKKLLAIIMAATLAVSMVACGSKDDSSNNNTDGGNTPAASLQEIMTQITDVPSLKEFSTMEVEMTADDWEYHTKTAMPEGAEGLVSDAVISAQAHSVVLIKLPEGADGEAIAKEILEKNTDGSPSKWLCVEAEKVEVVRKGNIILFVQSFEDSAKEIVDKFNEIK